MVKNGFIELSSLEDPLSKAFVVLGLDPLAVKLRRENNVGFPIVEFFDDLGNGLYLDTDVGEYEKNSRNFVNALGLGLGASHSHSKAGANLFEKMPKFVNQLDRETLNMLSTVRLTLLYLKGLFKKGILSDLHEFWNVARNNKWLLALEDCDALFKCLYH
ncbi:hypothetical protein QQP08_013205 [Theobroma cacao]|nr:hypothetical protein QQP08_013205 [Theobroma cacao]